MTISPWHGPHHGRDRQPRSATADEVAQIKVLVRRAMDAGPAGRKDLPAKQDRLVADAEGIGAVIVNGTVIRRENQDQVTPEGSLPGKLLRHGRASASPRTSFAAAG